MSREREIGGFVQEPDWPKMGPSLLIASCLILAVRMAKWPPRASGETSSDRDLEVEIDNAIHLAGRVFGVLVGRHETLFPGKREPWFMPEDEDVPK
ncbi:MAG TPA: hypothetical protein VGM02_14580 [Acidobacteriaceae bacterium]|jgi:hypothetical protein